jgi:hypothetical protein
MKSLKCHDDIPYLYAEKIAGYSSLKKAKRLPSESPQPPFKRGRERPLNEFDSKINQD